MNKLLNTAWNGVVMGIPAACLTPEMLATLPGTLRSQLEAKAVVSRQKMVAAEKASASTRTPTDEKAVLRRQLAILKGNGK
jgi:hypothetical protein